MIEDEVLLLSNLFLTSEVRVSGLYQFVIITDKQPACLPKIETLDSTVVYFNYAHKPLVMSSKNQEDPKNSFVVKA